MKTILTIDGGGIRGLIPALVLSELEMLTERPIASSFDLVAGTSTGGILAMGLTRAANGRKPAYTALRLTELYSQYGSTIFARSPWRSVSSVGTLADEKYPDKGLRKVLKQYFGEHRLKSSLCNTMVTAYDIERRSPVFLKSWREDSGEVLMREAARATAAAPTYFEPALVEINGEKRSLIDGGIFINNPAVSAYAEARRLFPDEELLLVSLGTGELTRPIMHEEACSWGKVGWLLPALSCMSDGVNDAADYQMRQILCDHYFRFQTPLDLAKDDMDDASTGNLLNLTEQAKRLIANQSEELNQLAQQLRMHKKA